MIIVKITLHVLIEKEKEVMQTLLSLIEPTCKEKGCLSYNVFRDIEDQNIFSLLEEWNNRENMNIHIKSDRFGVLLGTMSLLRKPMTIQIHTVSNSEGMKMVNTLRGKSILIYSI
ncbi:MAG: antibiotic biosynthesis monooxygenase [Desulfobacterales bacterium]|nr:antibiotic biosynthesis monooxygenase [Desulfobacterales bacterium]